MRINPTSAFNYNGFIHPEYIAYLEPLMRDRSVTIDDAIVPSADAIDWAKKGILDSLSVFGGTTTLEALVIKGEGPLIGDYVDELETTKKAYTWLRDYYRASPEKSIDALMKAISDWDIMQHQVKVIGAICIQDLDFQDLDELLSFIRRGRPRHERIFLGILYRLFSLHYMTDVNVINDRVKKASNDPFTHIEFAKIWAKLGDESKTREHLEMAEDFTTRDFFAWRAIASAYLKLLADFDASHVARRMQIAGACDLFCHSQTAIDLVTQVATPEAFSLAKTSMWRAEEFIRAGCDFLDLAEIWSEYFGDEERSDECKRLCDLHDRK